MDVHELHSLTKDIVALNQKLKYSYEAGHSPDYIWYLRLFRSWLRIKNNKLKTLVTNE